MSEERIDSVVDRAAVQKELAETSAEVRQLIELIKSVKNTGIQITGAKSVGDFNTINKQLQDQIKLTNAATTAVANQTKATIENNKAVQAESATLKQNIELRTRLQNTVNSYKADQKDDLALLRAGTITRKEYNQRIAESFTKIEVYKNKIGDLNKDIKVQLNAEKDAGNLYKQLSKEYNDAALAAKNYNLQLGATNPLTIQATEKAASLSAKLKELDATVGQNQRKVGDYGGAIVGFFGKAFSALRTISYILPGIGIAGIIGLITSAVGDMVVGLFNSSKAFDRNKESAKAYSAALKEVNEQAIKGSAADVAKLDLYRSIITDVTKSQKERTEALSAYNQIADDSLKIDEKNINNLNEVNDKISQQITLIEKRAFSRAAESILGEKAEALLLAKEAARAKAESDFAADLEAGRIMEVEQFDKVTGRFIKAGEKMIEMDNKRIIQGRINSDKTVRQRQVEFDASKQALYGLINLEGFTADEVKKIKDKTTKDKKKDKDLDDAYVKAKLEILTIEKNQQAEQQKEIFENEKNHLTVRLEAISKYVKLKQEIIEAANLYEFRQADLTGKERELLEVKRLDASLKLAKEAGEAIKKVYADINKSSDLKTSINAIPKSIQDAIDEINKKQLKLKEGLEKNLKDIKDAVKSLLSEIQGLIFDLFTGDIERQKNAIQDRIDLLDKQKQKEIEVANQSITNAQDKAAAIATIEARAAAEKEQLERKQRELDQQKAKFDRAEAIVSIIGNTARGVTAALASIPPNPVLAAIIGAIGAVQLARVISQPIPKYAQGGTHKRDGLAIVGDGGRSEGIQLPDGSIVKTPSRSTLVDIPAGSIIHKDYEKMMLSATITKVPEFRVRSVSDGTKEAIGKIGKDIVRAIKNQPQLILKAEPRWKKFMRTGSTTKDYLN